MSELPSTAGQQAPFQPWRLIAGALAALLLISAGAQWYARNVTLPRHCEDPAETLQRAREVLTERRPAGDGSRIAHIKAARLMFLIPRHSGEPLEDYMQRLRRHLDRQCR
ncbi:MAG TPA: hypothetical protein EYH03_01340 [Chromatiales bacterium]|nr:hypothetical protein [Chromatiales bacterium]